MVIPPAALPARANPARIVAKRRGWPTRAIDALPVIDRELRSVSFDAAVGLIDQPHALRCSLLLVLQHDRVRRCYTGHDRCGGRSCSDCHLRRHRRYDHRDRIRR